MKYLYFYKKIILVIISTIMSLGGAVNYGISGIWLAAPFMGYLLYVSYKKSKIYFIIACIFVVSCIFIYRTQDINPLIHPILVDGTVTLLQDGYMTNTKHEGRVIHSGFYIKESIAYCKECGQVEVVKLKKGEVYKVTKVYREADGFSKWVGVVTDVGSFQKQSFNYISLNKSIQSSWSDKLGNLMLYPNPLAFIMVFFYQ